MIPPRLYYVLDEDDDPVAVADVLEWAQWMERAKWDRVVLQTHIDRRGRRVAEVPIARRRGGVAVSTVFLGLDHAWTSGPPVLWETMIFGGVLDQEQSRYRSKLDALAGHTAAVARVEAIGPRLPRRLKCAIMKRRSWGRRLSPRERRALERFDRRINRETP